MNSLRSTGIGLLRGEDEGELAIAPAFWFGN